MLRLSLSKSRANILSTLSAAAWERKSDAWTKTSALSTGRPLQSPRSCLQLLSSQDVLSKRAIYSDRKVCPTNADPRICSNPLRLEGEDIRPTASATRLSRGSDAQ